MKFYKETNLEETSWLGQIPKNWTIFRLKETLTLLRNGLTTAQNKSGHGYPVTRIETISEEKIDPEKVGYISEINKKELAEYQLVEGDILLSHINSLEHIGKTAIYEGIPKVLIHGMNLLLLRPNKNMVYPKFLLYLLRFYRMKNIFRAIAKKAVNQASINQTELGRVKIPLPPFQEQQVIAEVLSCVDLAIQKIDEAIARAERLKKGLMQHLLTRGIGHKEYKQTPIGKIPKTWKIVKIREIGDLQYGFTASATQENTGIKFLRITDVKENGTVEWENVPYCRIDQNEINKYALRKGDILFARIGATAGKTCYIDRDIPGVFASYLIRLKVEAQNIHPKFVYYFTQSNLYWLQALRQREGQLKKGINATILSKFNVPLPSIDEQRKIAKILSSLDNVLRFKRKKRETLVRMKRRLMGLLLTGRVRVSV